MKLLRFTTIACALVVLVTLLGLVHSLHAQEGYSDARMAISPDGTLVAVSGPWSRKLGEMYSPIHILDADTGQLLMTFHDADLGPIIALDWSPDGTQVLGGDSAGSIDIWNVIDGTHTVLRRGNAPSEGASWSPAGNAILRMSAGFIQLLDPTTGKEFSNSLLPTLTLVRAAAWNSDGSRLAAVGREGIRVWDMTTTDWPLITEFASENSARTLAWSPDSSRLAAGGVNGVWVCNTATWQIDFSLPLNTPEGMGDVAWHPDGTLLAGSTPEAVDVWDAQTQQVITSYPVFYSMNVEWHPDGERLFFAGGPQGRPYVNGVLLGSPIANAGSAQTVPVGADTTALATADTQNLPSPTILAVAWSPDGSKLAVAGTQGVRVMDVAANQELPGFEDVAPPVYAIAWSPDGNKLASSGADKLINIWDVSNGTLITSLAGHDFSRLADMEWSPDGTKLASVVATIDDFTLRIWDVVNALTLAQFDASSLAEVVWSSDSSQLIVANTIIGVYIFDSSLAIPNAEGIQEYRIGPIEPIGSIALHPDGTTLAIGSFHQPVIYLWDIAANQQIGILQGHTDFVLALDWRPGTDILASVSLDGTLRTWDAESGQQIGVIDVGAKLYAVDWSPDGSRLVYGGETPDGQTEILKTIQFPVANAGPDQAVPAGTSATALVTLDGSGSSDSDGAIVAYRWYENDTLIAEGVTPQVELGVGEHIITLTVTDNCHLSSSDEVTVTSVPASSFIPTAPANSPTTTVTSFQPPSPLPFRPAVGRA